MRKILLLSAVALSVACGDAVGPDVSTVEFKGMPIFGGAPPDDARYDAVVGMYIVERTGTYICSGTLIAPRVVISAAHCFTSTRGRNIVTSDPADVYVYFGPELGGTASAVADVFVHPGYDPNDYGVNDLALLRLADDAPTTPMRTLPGSMAYLETVGTPVLFAGYGVTETDEIGTKLWVDGSISGVTATGLRNEQDDETGTCGGDSGGPLIYDFGGTWYLGGTTSWGDSACTDYGWSMRVSAFEGWIADYITPPEPPPPECTIDADCNDGDDCTDDSCTDGSCVNVDNGTCVSECLPKKAACDYDYECCSNRCHRNVCR